LASLVFLLAPANQSFYSMQPYVLGRIAFARGYAQQKLLARPSLGPANKLARPNNQQFGRSRYKEQQKVIVWRRFLKQLGNCLKMEDR